MRENIFYIFDIVTLTFDFYTSNLSLVYYLFIYLFIYLRTQHSKQYKIEDTIKAAKF